VNGGRESLFSTLRWKLPVVLLAVAYRLVFAVASFFALFGWLWFGWQCAAGAAAAVVMVMLSWIADRLKRESGIDPFDIRARWLDV
jgi:hypothetical protein